jgi:endonuclease/exonuclease/phosphatase family metal-dependent hydrolase
MQCAAAPLAFGGTLAILHMTVQGCCQNLRYAEWEESFVLKCLCWLIVLLAVQGAAAQAKEPPTTLTVVSFNVESDRDTDPRKVAKDIALISKEVDLFGLAEVRDAADLEVFRWAAEASDGKFKALLAKHGNEDRVAILYNQRAVSLKRVFELDRLPGSRKALVGQFRHQASGIDFLFMANHFNRRDFKRRQRQAQLIRDWVLEQELPAILVGDYNFDFDPKTEQGNAAFRIFTTKPGLRWVQPECIAKGTCPPNGTQCDGRYNSIMDFVLIADQRRDWRGISDVMLKRKDYCKRERKGYADHRPVIGIIAIR